VYVKPHSRTYNALPKTLRKWVADYPVTRGGALRVKHLNEETAIRLTAKRRHAKQLRHKMRLRRISMRHPRH
jgi:hypothetical protein